ncbi:hypothetical protein [Tepidiforma sp.]|uniref:hypothetical protein n=1 Tax=Tepidiforma sp. TaxID=2682230 RepID=UPI002ADE80FE|nr:hypothetical protein [Tepidiforma sp.]
MRSFLAWLDPFAAPAHAARRRYLWFGAISGLAAGITARVWMRTVTEDPRFTIPGTLLVLLVFTGMGTLTGLALWWRHSGSTRRGLVQRGAAGLPFLLLGPFMLFFLPSLLVPISRLRTGWPRLLRWAAAGLGAGTGALFALAILNHHGPAAAVLYLALLVGFAIPNRLLVAPQRKTPAPLAPAS